MIAPNNSSSRAAVRARRALPWRTAAAAGVCAAILYAATAARGPEWQDSGFHQYRIVTRQLEHPLGLALSHPLHYWVGRAVYAVSSHWGVAGLNLMSGFFGAVAVAGVAGLVTRLTWNVAAGGLAAAAVALAHSFWQMSAVTETYTLAAAAMVVEWMLLLRYLRTHRPGWLIAVFAVNGLHVANHLLGLLTLSTYLVLLLIEVLRRRCSWRVAGGAALAWLLGASPYLVLIGQHYLQVGDLAGTLRSALFGGGPIRPPGWQAEVLNLHPTWSQIKLALLSYGYCFPSLVIPLALLGVTTRAAPRWRRMLLRALLAQTLVILLFVIRYSILDLYTYFVPVSVVTAFWFGLGVNAIWRIAPAGVPRKVLAGVLVANALLPVFTYIAFPAVAEHKGWLQAQLRDIPVRNEYQHFFRPWRMLDDSPTRLSRAALEAAGPHGWILSDSTTFPPLVLLQLIQHEASPRRIFWLGRCMNDASLPELTQEILRAEVERGRRVIAIPSPEIERFAADLTIHKHGDFWLITAPAASAPATRVAGAIAQKQRSDYPAR